MLVVYAIGFIAFFYYFSFLAIVLHCVMCVFLCLNCRFSKYERFHEKVFRRVASKKYFFLSDKICTFAVCILIVL